MFAKWFRSLSEASLLVQLHAVTDVIWVTNGDWEGEGQGFTLWWWPQCISSDGTSRMTGCLWTTPQIHTQIFLMQNDENSEPELYEHHSCRIFPNCNVTDNATDYVHFILKKYWLSVITEWVKLSTTNYQRTSLIKQQELKRKAYLELVSEWSRRVENENEIKRSCMDYATGWRYER